MSYPYNPPPTFPQAPVSSMPYALPPTPAATPPNASGRYLRTSILVAVSLIFALALFNFLPGMVAQSVRAAYPRVHAVIGGVPSHNQIAAGQTVTFSADGSSGKDLTYLWTFDDGSISSQSSQSNQPTVTKTFTDPTHSYHVTLDVTDPLYASSNGADHTDEATITLTVLPPAPVASFTANQSSYDTYVDFDASGSTGSNLQYQWDFGDPSSYSNTASYSDPEHGYSAAGRYTVTLTVTDDYNQTNSTTKTITVTNPSA